MYHSGRTSVTVRMYGLVVRTNSLKRTHSGDESKPHDGCRATTYSVAHRKLSAAAMCTTIRRETYLVILHSQVLPFLLLMRHLHEKPTNERLPNILIVFPLVFILHRDEVDIGALHDALQLRADVFGLCERTGGEVV